jgi:uncharacterized tellurite resistance protein B-like protein
MNENEAIAKLMIATMMVDGDCDEKEELLILGLIEILNIEENRYNELLQEAKNLHSLDDFIDWCRSSIQEISEKNNDSSGWNALSVLFMALVAMADQKIDKNEYRLIIAVAEDLKVNVESLQSISA